MLIDGAKDTLTVFALHFNSNGVTKLHVLGAGLAIQNGFNGLLFGNATVAFGPFELAIDLNTFVADSATAHNRSCAYVARLANVGNQLAKVESHLGACVTHAHLAAIPCRLHA